MKKIQTIIKQLDFFADISEEALNEVSSRFTLEKFAPGETIFEEFSTGDSFFIIIEGEVEVSKHVGQSIETTQAELDVLGPYSYFG
ncbi:MAG TPA: cyclic nucleotide-binding domain-containing protein, partial [Candidatus Cloacimonadota bacterium]|nr:cyclic nucleotide-binding domain-containing protein [Candidatus Cloacimonadota bacterium]